MTNRRRWSRPCDTHALCRTVTRDSESRSGIRLSCASDSREVRPWQRH